MRCDFCSLVRYKVVHLVVKNNVAIGNAIVILTKVQYGFSGVSFNFGMAFGVAKGELNPHFVFSSSLPVEMLLSHNGFSFQDKWLVRVARYFKRRRFHRPVFKSGLGFRVRFVVGFF